MWKSIAALHSPPAQADHIHCDANLDNWMVSGSQMSVTKQASCKMKFVSPSHCQVMKLNSQLFCCMFGLYLAQGEAS